MPQPHRFPRTTRLIRAYANFEGSTYTTLVSRSRQLCPDLPRRRAITDLARWIREYHQAPMCVQAPAIIFELTSVVGSRR